MSSHNKCQKHLSQLRFLFRNVIFLKQQKHLQKNKAVKHNNLINFIVDFKVPLLSYFWFLSHKTGIKGWQLPSIRDRMQSQRLELDQKQIKFNIYFLPLHCCPGMRKARDFGTMMSTSNSAWLFAPRGTWGNT